MLKRKTKRIKNIKSIKSIKSIKNIKRIKRIKRKTKHFKKGGETFNRTRRAIKIQRAQRRHTARKPDYIVRESERFKLLIKKGATIYKKQIEALHARGLSLRGIVLSSRSLNGIDLRGADFTTTKLNGTNLIGAKLNGANFTEAELKKADLTGANLTNTIFNLAKLNEANFTGANLTRAKIEDAIISKANFTNANLTEASFYKTEFYINKVEHHPTFHNTNFHRALFEKLSNVLFLMNNGNILTELFIMGIDEEKNFIDIEWPKFKLVDIEFNKCNFRNVNFSGSTMDQSTFIECDINACKFQDIKVRDMDLVYATLEEVNFSNSNFRNCHIYDQTTLLNVNFSGSTMDQSTFTDCSINTCNFKDIIATNKMEVYRSIISNCNFQNAQLIGAEFIDCSFVNPIWNNTNLTNVDFNKSRLAGLNFEGTTLKNANFRYQNLSGTNFRNADLTNAHFNAVDDVAVVFDIDTDFKGATLIGANFQYAEGLQRHDFNGLIMNGASFIGCDLTGATFIGTDVRHVTFYHANLTDCDFSGARVDNVGYDGSTEGLDSTVGLIRAGRQEQIPQEIHKAWAHVLKNATLNFLSNQVTTHTTTHTTTHIKPTTSRTMARYINETLGTLIRNSNEKELIKNKWSGQIDQCKPYYEDWDYMGILPGTNPSITYCDIAFAALEYVKSESNEFKNLYLEGLFEENTKAHGEGGLSCTKGMVERLVVKLIEPSHSMTTVTPERRFHYNRLINLLEPLYKLPEDLVAERAIPAYVDIEIGAALRDEWHDLHKIGSGREFENMEDLDDGIMDEIMANYKEFLENKFRDIVMTQELDDNIQKAIEEMRAVIEHDNEYFEGGSRRRRRRRQKQPLYTRIFSMSTREFSKLFKKL